MKTIYQFKAGAHVRGDAQAVGERLDALRERGGLTPAAVVSDATDKTSALHNLFEWDNRKAAERYRLEQAAHIIRSVVVVIEDATPQGALEKQTKATATVVRAFLPVDRDDGARVYEATAQVLGSEDYRRQVLKQAHAELGAVARKYRELEQLAAVVAEIDRVGELLKEGLPN